jgi:FAD/FMN-containing dehydrogenase
MGIFSCYRPVADDAPEPQSRKELSLDDWKELVYLAHVRPTEAFDRYAAHYLATSGQLYWSDTHQMSTYLDSYHQGLDRKLGAAQKGSEVITEIYVPRQELSRFLDDVRRDFRKNAAAIIYGTIRFIEQDRESFLAWAKQRYACIIFNLHVTHSPSGREQAQAAFTRLIDAAIRYGGSYYLTYHRFASRKQLETCYPQFPEFLRLKRHYDPNERFQSDWYRHYNG